MYSNRADFKKNRHMGKGLALIICSALFLNVINPLTVKAAGPEKILQLKTKGIDGPARNSKDAGGDFVTYSDCYFYKEVWDTAQPVLAPPVVYQVTKAYSYDRNLKKRVMDVKSTIDGSTRQISLPEIAFVSAAVGGKVSNYDNGGDLTPVSEAEVNNWKLTIKNPYDKETNPHGMREPEISNIRRQGGAVCFDYKNLYSTGNCYLSAILLTRYEREIVAYGRIVDASYRGNGTAVINWPHNYDEEGYVLKVFAEKYNGDNMTDYISDIQYIYQGFDPDPDSDWHYKR